MQAEEGRTSPDVDAALNNLVAICEIHVRKRKKSWTDIRDALVRFKQASCLHHMASTQEVWVKADMWGFGIKRERITCQDCGAVWLQDSPVMGKALPVER